MTIGGSNSSERIAKFEELFPKYVQVAKTCYGHEAGCMPVSYIYGVIGATEDIQIGGRSGNTNSFLLKNGMSIRATSGGTCQQDITLQKKAIRSMIPAAHTATQPSIMALICTTVSTYLLISMVLQILIKLI